jgi:iron complex transport system ATP-binding protein
MLRELCTNNSERDNSASNIGVLVIVHDLNLASFYCDKILLLDGGRLIAHDASKKIFQRDIIKKSFGTDVFIESHPDTYKPYLIPKLQ